MNEDQHQGRIALWLGSFSAIAVFVLLILVLLLSDHAAPVIPKKLDGSNSIGQGVHPPELGSQVSEPIPAESP